MEKQYAKHEKDYIRVYEKQGYSSHFHMESDKLVSNNNNEYNPIDVHIVAEHRYEGMSNPSDMSILYVIETNKGEKGTFLLAYGPNADTEAAEFFKNIPNTNVSDKANINK